MLSAVRHWIALERDLFSQAMKTGLKEKSEKLLEDCIKETVEDMDFSAADEYLSKIVNNCQ